jgi:hypothetical protein
MQEKIVKIPFNEEFYIKSQRAVWAYGYKKSQSYNIFNTAMVIILLFEGFMFGDRKGFSFILTLGTGSAIYMFLTWLNIFFRRRRVFKVIYKSAIRYEQEQLDCTFEFSDDFLVYKDKDKMFQMKWHTFSKVVTFKDNILLIAKYSNNALFTFSRLELGDEEYQEVYDILTERIK